MLALSLALFVSGALGAALQGRAVSCPTFMSSVSALTTAQQTALNAFCVQNLALVPKTTTSTQTNTVKTVANTIKTTSTRVNVVTQAAQTKTVNTATTLRVSVTPDVSTVQATVTSTAYLDNEGNTITVMKRSDPSPVELAARALATPAILSGYSRADVKSACLCLGLVASTVQRKATVLATSTRLATQTYVLVKPTTTVLPPVTITNVATKYLTVTAQAPLATATSVFYDQEASCYPGSTQTFMCPVATGDDDGSLADEDQYACPAISDDGFSGYCEYWENDGSPVDNVWTLDDGSGNLKYRDAVYGDDDTSDCPAWADWTCAPSGSRKRGFFGGVDGGDEMEVAKRWYELNEMSERSDDSTLVARAKTHKKKKMPKGLKKSGLYHPYTQVADRITGA